MHFEVADEVLFEKGGITDFQVRKKMNMPSVDCILMRKRLSYLGRLACEKSPQALLTLLGQVDLNGRHLSEWTRLVRKDMET